MVQWLRRCAPNEGSPGSISGQGTRTRMPQPRVCVAQQRSKIPYASTKTRHGQINNTKKKRKETIVVLCAKCTIERNSGENRNSR